MYPGDPGSDLDPIPKASTSQAIAATLLKIDRFRERSTLL